MRFALLLILAACGGETATPDEPAADNTADAAGQIEAPEPAAPPAAPTRPADFDKAPADVAAAPADATKTASGLAYKVLQAGSGGQKPTAEATVKVHYTGWTTDGKMFDSSIMRGKPARFPLSQVIPGWTEGVQLMVEGEKRRLWIPEELAYKGRPGAPQGMLVFDIELLKILGASPH